MGAINDKDIVQKQYKKATKLNTGHCDHQYDAVSALSVMEYAPSLTDLTEAWAAAFLTVALACQQRQAGYQRRV